MDHKPYQFDGVQWCVRSERRVCSSDSLFHDSLRGGFLADEMGLGKTIMMIGTFIVHFVPKTLIVVPVILIEQWYDQIYKTTGHKALIYHGSHKKKITKSDLDKSIVVITSYAHISVHKKTGQPQGMLHEIEWSRVVFDEAHHLRNKKTTRYIGAIMLKKKICWLVTGTPVQNRKRDFYNLCALLKIPKTSEPEGIADIISTFILRRTKKQVGILIPDVKTIYHHVEWGYEKEFLLSRKIHTQLTINSAFQLEPHEKIKKNMENQLYIKIPSQMELFIRARQCCILPNLVHSSSSLVLDSSKIPTSSKLENVVTCVLSKKDNGNGKLIFCTYRKEIDTIAAKLRNGGVEHIAIFDGRHPVKKTSFALDLVITVLIIQIQTGCEGLNLQEKFSEIYFVSPNWNPYMEDQAIARCHRIGQTKEVFVHKFDMVNSVVENENLKWMNMDEYILCLQDKKREIVRELVSCAK